MVKDSTPSLPVQPGENSSAPTLRDCLITGNGASGVYCPSGSSPTLVGYIITANPTAGMSCAKESSPTLVHCTITGNRGAGVAGVEGRALFKNSIVWANGDDSIEVDESTVTVSYSCIQGPGLWPGEGNINNDPLFFGGCGGPVPGEHRGCRECGPSEFASDAALGCAQGPASCR